MTEPKLVRGGLSIARLRALILVILVAGVSLFTGVMFTLVSELSHQFGPQVRADLEWRAQRGAQELAKTVDLGLVMSDPPTVREAFGVYATSHDVQAIIAADASGTTVATHGSFDDAERVWSAKAGELVHGSSYLASWAPAVIEGHDVGKVAVVVSTRRLADAEAQLHSVSRAALLAGVIGLVLGALVIVFFTRAVQTRDNQLAEHAATLERKVEERTRDLDACNRGMRLVLDNVAQGFITIDPHGVIASERSAIVERWFGPLPAGTTFMAAVEPFAPEFAAWFELSLSSARDGLLPVELALDQIPRRFAKGAQTFEIDFKPLFDGEALASVLVITSDVTAQIERERTEREQRETVEVFQRISADRSGFEEFYADARSLVEQLRLAQDAVTEKRIIHTLKGNCGVFGIHSFALACHEVETQIEENGGAVTPAHRERLLAAWADVSTRLRPLVEERRQPVVEIDRAELLRVVQLAQHAQSGGPSGELAATLASWAHEPVRARFERLGRHAVALARRLGRANLAVDIDDNAIRLDAAHFGPLWSVIIHAVRNAVDHGIETAEERAAVDKPATATLTLRARREAGELQLVLADDGRGIAWDGIRRKAIALGLPHDTQDDLVEALFGDGVSTREQANETSGRGVGMSALRDVVVGQLGGSIAISSSAGRGTTLRMTFRECVGASAAA